MPSTEQAGTQASRAWGLAHHFDNFEQQREASYLGMWVFLVTEIMFFGGLFTAYVVYRSANARAFALGSKELDITLGAFNTAVLIGSSLTMALAVRAAQLGRRKQIALFLILTILLGGVFLGVKVMEYRAKIDHHLLPGPDFHYEVTEVDEILGVQEGNVEMFFNLYFAMTGLHALHMIIGIGVLLVMVVLALRGSFSRENHNLVECMGLYWHFVDIIWIFLFPLLYLLGRNL
jgi:cytochrome c oxidase subunit 3